MKVIYLFISSPIEINIGKEWKLEWKKKLKTINSLYSREIETEDTQSMSLLREETDNIQRSHPYSTIKVIIL